MNKLLLSTILIILSFMCFGQETHSMAVSSYFFISSGNWNDGTHWSTGEVPSEGSDVIIMADAVIPAGYTAVANQVSLQGGSIIVADGGQLKHNTQDLVVTMEKSIAAFNEANSWSNYYLLAFPFSEDVAVPASMTAAEDNDFYTFNPDYPSAEWRNNKQQVITTVGGTTGYLYANSEAIELSLTGSTYQSYGEATVTVEVPYTEGSSNVFNGWVLLGNPFTCNAYVYALENGSCVPKEFMVYDAEGELVRCSCSSIAPMQGFFVKVEETTTICIKTTAPYVDLGLPSGTLWAACNVGALAPEDYGDYFAWGETQPKDTYNWSTYQYCNGSYNTLTKYCNNSSYGYNGFTDNLNTLLPEDDAATANWGSDWRMPTDEEWQELYQNTTHTWTAQNGVNGRLFTASNGNSLFLPAAGYCGDSTLSDAGNYGVFWSSSLYIAYLDYSDRAWFFNFGSGNYSMHINYRSFGQSVRPVRSGSQNTSFIINATANPADGGEISGNGTYQEGAECTLIATANEGYTFSNWTENDSVVSTESNYTFIVNADRNLVANFTLQSYTINVSASPSDGGSVSGGDSYYYGQSCTVSATANTGFIFSNWTENDSVVSTNATYTFTVNADRTLVANLKIPCPTGAVDAKFSINGNGDMVYFSQGNLQYQPSTHTWKFAENQYNYIGNANSNVSQNYSGWIDLFGWGTSGYNHGAVCYQPWSISENNSDYLAYGYSSYNLNEQSGQADWGYNAISNGGNQTNQWRTLTKAEWVFLLNTRVTTSGIRFAMAKVNNINGVIILPDNWSSTCYALNNTNNTRASFSSNSISLSSWSILEANGAVFLPAAGFRDGTYVYGVGSYGGYQTASYYNSNGVYDLYFSNSYLILEGTCPRSNAQSVRLVRSVPTYTINASSIPFAGGSVTGMGNYAKGEFCTLTAVANPGYTFVNWIENGEEVSTEASYSFTVMGNRNLVASYSISCPAGAIDGKFTINSDGNEVYFSQGNLQYIGSVSTPFWKFADNQWDYFGTTTGQNSSVENIDRDLFGWGTSGYDHGAACYQPWSMSTTYDYYYAYGNKEYNLYDQTGQADWGYNPISNGGNQPNQWRTLTKQEWDYVFDTRTSPSGIRYAKAKVNEVNGMILLPDDWDASYYFLTNTNSSSADFSSNTITASQWSVLEQYGAVFLPAAGYRYGTSVENVSSNGYYWSASYRSKKYSHYMGFNSSGFGTDYGSRYLGYSVRLACPSYFIEANSNIPEGGTVTGLGSYHHGSTVTLIANANEGYVFSKWIENGEIVATDATYSFIATGNRDLVACFIPQDCPIGAIHGKFTINSSGNQVYFSQGNLQYIGSASTPYWQFAEHQWDYFGNNGQGSTNQDVDRDLFGWGTSGYHYLGDPYNVNYQPWSTSASTVNTNYNGFGYGPSTNMSSPNLTGNSANYDWGVYNAISNGGNIANQWRTLTKLEWDYILNTRNTYSGIRYVKAKVNYVKGVILLPDDWDSDTYILNNTNSNDSSFSSNTLTVSQWSTLEQVGAVFLPVAGERNETSVGYVGNYGYYWSASYGSGSNYSAYDAYHMFFGDSILGTNYTNRWYGNSVRLVHNVQ